MDILPQDHRRRAAKQHHRTLDTLAPPATARSARIPLPSENHSPDPGTRT